MIVSSMTPFLIAFTIIVSVTVVLSAMYLTRCYRGMPASQGIVDMCYIVPSNAGYDVTKDKPDTKGVLDRLSRLGYDIG